MRLQARHDEPTASPPRVDQLLRGQARPRPQVGEAALDGAGRMPTSLAASDGSAAGDEGGEDVDLALRGLRREGAA